MHTKALFVGLVLMVAGRTVSSLQAHETPSPLQKDVTEAIELFKRADSTLAPFFESAAGYAVFPNVGKGGFVFGGARGHGLVFEKGKPDKPIGKATLTQATFGAQIGGQVFRQVIFFETTSALDAFKQSNVEMNAQIGAVVAAEGVAKNAKYQDGVLIFTRAVKGLMGEASVGGQKFKFEPLP